MFYLNYYVLHLQEKEDFKNRVMELELSEDKKSAQIRELTRIVISLRDEMHKKNSGFFSNSKQAPEPIPPELEFKDTPVDNSLKPVPQNVEHQIFSGFDVGQLSRDLAPVFRAAIFLPSTMMISFEEA